MIKILRKIGQKKKDCWKKNRWKKKQNRLSPTYFWIHPFPQLDTPCSCDLGAWESCDHFLVWKIGV